MRPSTCSSRMRAVAGDRDVFVYRLHQRSLLIDLNGIFDRLKAGSERRDAVGLFLLFRVERQIAIGDVALRPLELEERQQRIAQSAVRIGLEGDDDEGIQVANPDLLVVRARIETRSSADRAPFDAPGAGSGRRESVWPAPRRCWHGPRPSPPLSARGGAGQRKISTRFIEQFHIPQEVMAACRSTKAARRWARSPMPGWVSRRARNATCRRRQCRGTKSNSGCAGGR